MTREECWMTFSEALECYLSNREMLSHFGPGWNRTQREKAMKNAAEHMDALTSQDQVDKGAKE